ncbi:hypothetical protein KR059_003240, partial [Drosophila kikkawai]
MDTLRQSISQFFNKSKPKSVEVQTEPKSVEIQTEPKPKDSKTEKDSLEPITSGDLPTPEIKIKKFSTEPNVADFNYEMEFVDFLDRNSPKGLSKKLIDMLPYLEIGFFSWPAYWLYRGYNWQHRRNTERISFYIQRVRANSKMLLI